MALSPGKILNNLTSHTPNPCHQKEANLRKEDRLILGFQFQYFLKPPPTILGFFNLLRIRIIAPSGKIVSA